MTHKYSAPQRKSHFLMNVVVVFGYFYGGTASAASRIDTGTLIDRVCPGTGQIYNISQSDLAENILIESGNSPFLQISDIYTELLEQNNNIKKRDVSEIYKQALYKYLSNIVAWRDGGRDGNHPEDKDGVIIGAIDDLQQSLTIKGGNFSFSTDNIDDNGIKKLFVEKNPGRHLVCKKNDPEKDQVNKLEDLKPSSRFAFREKPEELWLGGKAGRKAGAFKFGYERTRAAENDGASKTSQTATINGTAGYRLTPDESAWGGAYLYANYALSQARTKPKPILDPGKAESDGDTHVLSIGVDTHLEYSVLGLETDINFITAYDIDFANHARRLRVKTLATPGFNKDIGVCNLGSFRFFGEGSSGGLHTRCAIEPEIEATRLIKRGEIEFGSFDSFVAVGGRLTFEAFLPTSDGNPDDGLFFRTKYRYLPLIKGDPKNIERLSIELKHRFWTPLNAGFDVGFSFEDGTNELSFEKENKLTFGLGVIF